MAATPLGLAPALRRMGRAGQARVRRCPDGRDRRPAAAGHEAHASARAGRVAQDPAPTLRRKARAIFDRLLRCLRSRPRPAVLRPERERRGQDGRRVPAPARPGDPADRLALDPRLRVHPRPGAQGDDRAMSRAEARGPRSGAAAQARLRHPAHRARRAQPWTSLLAYVVSAIAISGSSGLVGARLAARLAGLGHRVLRLVRRPVRSGAYEIAWDPARGVLDAGALSGLDAVVHLAGESIASGRWSRARKARIRDSRVDGTRLIACSLARLERPPRVLVSASAIGFYGDRGEEPLDETAPAGRGFLAETCQAWEQATEPARRAGLRIVTPRIGVVLSPAGGALARMLPAFRFGL